MSQRAAVNLSVQREVPSEKVRSSADRAAHLEPQLKSDATAAIAVEQCASVAEIDSSEWDQLAGESVLASHGLLSTIEETCVTGHAARYFIARKHVELVGAIVCHVEESRHQDGAIPIGGHRLDRMMLGRLAEWGRKAGVVTLPCLMCGTQIGTRDPLILRSGEDEGVRIAEALVEAIERASRKEGWTVCFRQVRREASPLAAVLATRGYLRGAELPTACLELDRQWKSFEDYRKHLKQAHPHTAKTVSGETNRGTKSGLTIQVVNDPGEHRAEFHRLMENHNLSHNAKPWPFGADFFDGVKKRLGSRAVIHGAKLNGQWAGVGVVLQGGGDAVAAMIGIDAGANRGAAIYFNLAYNYLIEESIKAGRQRVYYGTLLWDLKARRGCTAVETDFYLKGKNPPQQMFLRPLVEVRSKKHDAISSPLRRGQRKSGADA